MDGKDADLPAELDFARAGDPSGIPVRRHDHIYVARGPHREPTGPGLATTHAEDSILTWRWWTRKELHEATEVVWPPELARLLDELTEGPGAWNG